MSDICDIWKKQLLRCEFRSISQKNLKNSRFVVGWSKNLKLLFWLRFWRPAFFLKRILFQTPLKYLHCQKSCSQTFWLHFTMLQKCFWKDKRGLLTRHCKIMKPFEKKHYLNKLYYETLTIHFIVQEHSANADVHKQCDF